MIVKADVPEFHHTTDSTSDLLSGSIGHVKMTTRIAGYTAMPSKKEALAKHRRLMARASLQTDNGTADERSNGMVDDTLASQVEEEVEDVAAEKGCHSLSESDW